MRLMSTAQALVLAELGYKIRRSVWNDGEYISLNLDTSILEDMNEMPITIKGLKNKDWEVYGDVRNLSWSTIESVIEAHVPASHSMIEIKKLLGYK